MNFPSHLFRFYLLVVLLFGCCTLIKSQTIKIYPDKMPGSKDVGVSDHVESEGLVRQVVTPTLELFLPEKEKSTGVGVVICPGGGYSVIVYGGEGVQTAKEFVKRGIAAFVLKYRLPSDDIMQNKTTGPLQDAQQAIELVRKNAKEWNVDPNRIGIMGFSAGGHLASTAATHYSNVLIENSDSISVRPDFQILVYPVISMQDKLTHVGSRNQLLGNNPSQDLKDLYSNELQVDENTPPAYITHAADDELVDVDNSIQYFEKLRHYGVSVEMHIYPEGNHGFIFKHPGWMEPLFKWMETSGLTKKQ